MSRSFVGSSSTSRSAGSSISRARMDARLLAARRAGRPASGAARAGRGSAAPSPRRGPAGRGRRPDRPRARARGERDARDRAACGTGRGAPSRSPSACRTRPVSGARSPVSSRMSVVLPLPFGPRRPSRVPGPSTRLASIDDARDRRTASPTCSATTRRFVRRSLASKSIAARPAVEPLRRRARARRSAGPPRGCAPAPSSCAPSGRARSHLDLAAHAVRERLVLRAACSRSAASFRSRNSL